MVVVVTTKEILVVSVIKIKVMTTKRSQLATIQLAVIIAPLALGIT